MEITEDRSSELDNMSVESLQSEQQKLHKISIIKVPEEECGTQKIFLKIMVQTHQISEILNLRCKNLSKSQIGKPKKSMSRHIKIKLL